jgi:hypothetical protein
VGRWQSIEIGVEANGKISIAFDRTGKIDEFKISRMFENGENPPLG